MQLDEDVARAKQLLRLCAEGRLYDVEAWIRAGQSVNAPPGSRKSPLVVAIEKGFHSLVKLLLRHGARDLRALEIAIRHRNVGIVALLLDHGVAPNSISAALICESGNKEIVQLFLDRGADLTEGNGFAIGLAKTKRALLGVYRSYRDRIPALQQQADIALRHCCSEGYIGTAYLLLWAGANPRAKVPDLAHPQDGPEMYGTAIEALAFGGHCELLKRIGLDASRDDLDDLLYSSTFAADSNTIRYLVECGANINSRCEGNQTVLGRLFATLHWRNNPNAFPGGSADSSRATEAIHTAVKLGAKWERSDAHATRLVREAFCHAGEHQLLFLLETFRKHGACTDKELVRLLDTPQILRKYENNLKPFVRMLPQWRHAQERYAEMEEKRRRGRY